MAPITAIGLSPHLVPALAPNLKRTLHATLFSDFPELE
jgi:hypothetical protein